MINSKSLNVKMKAVLLTFNYCSFLRNINLYFYLNPKPKKYQFISVII